MTKGSEKAGILEKKKKKSSNINDSTFQSTSSMG